MDVLSRKTTPCSLLWICTCHLTRASDCIYQKCTPENRTLTLLARSSQMRMWGLRWTHIRIEHLRLRRLQSRCFSFAVATCSLTVIQAHLELQCIVSVWVAASFNTACAKGRPSEHIGRLPSVLQCELTFAHLRYVQISYGFPHAKRRYGQSKRSHDQQKDDCVRTALQFQRCLQRRFSFFKPSTRALTEWIVKCNLRMSSSLACIVTIQKGQEGVNSK